MDVFVDHLRDFTVVGIPGEYAYDFKVYQVAGSSQPEHDQLYRKANGESWDLTDKISEAAVFLSGTIKWDGCGHLHFDEQEEAAAIHVCGSDGATSLAELIEHLWKLGSQHVQNWDNVIAK